MDRIVYEGKEYIRRRDKWSYNNEIVTDILQRKLTKLFDQTNPIINVDTHVIPNAVSGSLKPDATRSKRRNYPLKNTGRNYAIKCNFCDGGADNDRIGFAGLCSDAVREANTKRSKEIWCGNEQNPCRMYVKGLLTKEELLCCYKEDRIKNGTPGFCNEVKILAEWRVGAGSNTRKGVRQGTRRAFPGAKPDSLCVLTTRDPYYSTEADRYIFGAFIIEKVQAGDEFSEGYLYGNEKLAISFNSTEAHQLQYYRYKRWDDNKEKVWGNGLHRIFTDEEALDMLNAFIEVKKTSEGKEMAQRMKEHFLKYHPIDVDCTN